jgi:hypothetical protein
MAEIAKSYYSLHTTVSSDASSSEFNVFKAGNYTGDSFTATETKTSDISHSTSTGEITFSEAGTYLIIVNAYVENEGSSNPVDVLVKRTPSGGGGAAEIVDVEAFMVNANSSNEQKPGTFHFLKTLTANDKIEVFIDGSGTSFKAIAGFSIVAMRARGKYGNLIYTAEPDNVAADSGNVLKTSFDSDDGGTVVSTLDGVTYTAATGKLTPSVSTNYLMFSTLVHSFAGNQHFENRIYANDSELVSPKVKANSPGASSFGIVKQLTASQTASRRARHVKGANGVTSEEKGSAFTIFDISDGAATSPQAPANILSFSTTGESEDLLLNSTNDGADPYDIFHETNHDSSLSKSDNVTAANITYSAANGKFTFSNAGDYLIMVNAPVEIVTAGNSNAYNPAAGSTLQVIKNAGGTPIWSGMIGVNPSQPVNDHAAFFIATLAQNDYLNFKIANPEGKLLTGASVTIFNVDSATADDGAAAPAEDPGPSSTPISTASKPNVWTQPDAPPPPLFAGKKERDLVKQVNDELIERVIGQTVAYYPIDTITTNFHSLYGEAIVKNFLPPIRVYALVEFDGINTKFENSIGLDKVTEISVHFHKRRLTEDQDLFVREGDFVAYGKFFYEIVSLSEPRPLYGQVDHLLEISAKCIRAREDLFDAS